MKPESLWRIRLSAAANADFCAILGWTAERFGRDQAGIYADILGQALEDLMQGPEIEGVWKRSDIGKDIRLLHVARKGRKGRHFVMFRALKSASPPTIDVLRLLHGQMDLSSHLD
ncbi:MAG: type II toxin-antitoxin system RelE/ParE family toxin [Rhodospirillales bacterium]|jgi:toxin ParE1/3/4|nr:type II toxin-antitoxin system RelE/ParE family toxin [Rhodospirillales bacterium]